MVGEGEHKNHAENSPSHPEEDLPVMKPPDGGWGWVVVFGSFVIHLIADGMSYSFGIYVEAFLEEFRATRTQVGFLGSLMLGITWGSGPVAGVLTKGHGCRKVTIIGTGIAAIGFIISIIAPNIYFMFFSFGLVAGIGLGFAYLPAIVAVSFYFEKRRSLATGLAVCGSGVGTIIFAPLTEILLQEFGWKGTVLIEVAILLNCIPCGAVFRPLKLPRCRPNPTVPKKEDPVFRTLAKAEHERKIPLPEIRLPREEPPQQKPEIVKRGLKTPEPSPQKVDRSVNELKTNKPTDKSPQRLESSVIQSETNRPTDKSPQKTESSNEEVETNKSTVKSSEKLESSDKDSKISNHSALSSSHNLHEASENVSKLSVEKESISSKQNINANAEPSDKEVVTTANPMDRKDVFYTRSLQNIPAFEANPDQYRKSVTSIPLCTETPVAADEDNFCCCCIRPVMRLCSSVSKSMDCNLMTDPCFLLFTISNLLTSIGFTVPYIFLPNRVTLNQMTQRQGAYLISIIGFTNTVGRVLFGFLADFKWVNRMFLYNTALVICGGLTLLSAVCTTFASMAVYAAGFGLFIGVYVCLTPVVLVDLIGLEKLSTAFGIVLLFQGIGTIIGPPMTGAVYDFTLNYDDSFYLAGICILVSGAMLYGIPSIQRRRREKIKSIETTA